jgi:hypothetical protein
MIKYLSIKYALIDLLISPLTLISAKCLKYIRKNIYGFTSNRSIISKKIFNKVGVFPILDHYYEPLFNQERLRHSLRTDRELKAINFNTSEQLSILESFKFNDEIIEISKRPSHQLTYSFTNANFCSGDAEYLFNFVRQFKPKRIIEIGCGDSTLVMQHAIENNKKEDFTYNCTHICIEPYHNEWLEKLPIHLNRSIVENVDIGIFKTLQKSDLLFIDSSHIIRPQGDVLFEYLEILPILNAGVFVHIHDIFTPKDYLSEWILDGKVFWNEQYLLEAFLSFNTCFKIIGALNFLKHHYYAELSSKCPFLSKDREPGSFWIKKEN